jgi:CAAX prenyl protease-like protein
MQQKSNTQATLGFIAPFLVFVGLMGIEKSFNLPGAWLYPLRFAATLGVLLIYSRPYLSFRPTAPVYSIALGILVFVIWIAPDQLFHYRHHWLFENSITGNASSSLPPDLQGNPLFLILRCISSFALVPVLEELFWRGWMMRWLIDNDFRKVPLGKYAPISFWVVALLFASEHGPYWEVGLAAGALYNWWMVRTGSLADCILAHSVTNATLCGWVLATGEWQYWL